MRGGLEDEADSGGCGSSESCVRLFMLIGGRVVWLGEEEEREYGKGLIGCAAVSDGRVSEGLTGTIRFRTLVLLKNV